MAEAYFPELDIAARRLGLDAGEMAEAMLCRLDAGLGYWQALHQVIREAAQRRGTYSGEVKARIDSGDIFLPRPMPFIESGGRMLEAVADGRIDAFDALAMAGAMQEPGGDFSEHEHGRAARLAAVAVDGDAGLHHPGR